jgi:hypothetical protein
MDNHAGHRLFPSCGACGLEEISDIGVSASACVRARNGSGSTRGGSIHWFPCSSSACNATIPVQCSRTQQVRTYSSPSLPLEILRYVCPVLSVAGRITFGAGTASTRPQRGNGLRRRRRHCGFGFLGSQWDTFTLRVRRHVQPRQTCQSLRR